MEFHEMANIFPMMGADEYEALKHDIAANGLLEPIWTYQGKIIDGRNRYNACEELGVVPVFREWEGNGSLIAFIVSLNLKRRHLSSSQKAMVALEIEKQLAVEAKKRMLAGVCNPTQLFAQGEARQQAAEIVGTNHQYVSDAKLIQEKSPELADRVRSGEMTIPEAKREIVRRDRQEAPELPTGKYRIIYADPPWKYGNDGVIGGNDNYGHVSRHYPSMSIEELCALPVSELADDNAVLFIWVTSPLLEESFDVIHSWGFKYKTSFVWDKVKHNFGHYNSVRHELLLICTRGSCTPDNLELFDSVQVIERTDVHSQKPVEFRNIIDTIYTRGKRIELFAREAFSGWETWGNEPDICRIGD